jgi:hypothetical protein
MLFGKDKRSRTERELRDARPRAPHDLLDALSAEAAPARRGRNGYRTAGARLAVLGIAVVALAAVGGIGFAASTAINATKVKVQKVAAGSARSVSVTQAVRNAARDQYDDGTVVTKTGPPQLTVAGGTDEPITGKVVKGTTNITLTATITPNESGTLSIQVLDSKGVPVKMNGALTTVDGEAVGENQAVVYRFVVKQPRKLAISISIPGSSVAAGDDLDIKLGYTDADASRKRTVITVPAEAPETLPKTTKTFRLTSGDLAAIAEQAADDGLYAVSFRVAVKGDTPITTIAWNGQTITGKAAGPFTFDADDDTLDSTAVVTVAGGTIGAGDFQIQKPVPPKVGSTVCKLTASVMRTSKKNKIFLKVTGTANCGIETVKLLANVAGREIRSRDSVTNGKYRFDQSFKIKPNQKNAEGTVRVTATVNGAQLSTGYITIPKAGGSASGEDDRSVVDTSPEDEG